MTDCFWFNYESLRNDSSLRKFIIPKVQFSSNSYYELITINEDWLEPRLTMSLDNEVIINFKDNSVDHGFDVYPCHSHAVELIIQFVS